ncbi:LTV1 ribosome biogenesis factor [Oratosquilla oratoria]|uniref:LTV1 ribosome biogenesis factor n=1 Tax=Oratosquilla oratoria TaxID=337810 RepID=UPI003F76C551
MGKKRRKFIDPKRDVLHTFKVVARSQQDPLAADEEAPQAVLQPNQMADNKKEEQKYGIYFDDDYDYLQHLKGVQDGINWDSEETEVYMIRKEDVQARGKELKENKLMLPSSAFESYVEEPVGLLNKAAPVTGPQPQLDPDVVAALDDDSQLFSPDDENALPDNFVSLLNSDNALSNFDDEGEWEDELDEDIWGDENGDDADDEDEDEMPALEEGMEGIHFIPDLMRHRKPKVIDEDEERDFSSDFNDSDDDDSEARDTLGRLGGPALTFRSEENKSHFTDYSLTSSVLKRTQLMSTLDDRFEEMFMKEYDEEYVGALDGEDIAGFVAENSPLFKQAVERSLKQLKRDDAIDDQEWIINWIKDMQRRKEELGEKEELEEVAVLEEEPSERWDCETILSTYSNIYNHPKLIEDKPKKRITVDPRTGMPVEHRGGLTKRALAQLDRDAEDGKQDLDTATLITSMSTISIRPPGETAEERRTRKKALKELRRERRVEKKLNRSAFREEKKKQEKSLINARHNKSIPVV